MRWIGDIERSTMHEEMRHRRKKQHEDGVGISSSHRPRGRETPRVDVLHTSMNIIQALNLLNS